MRKPRFRFIDWAGPAYAGSIANDLVDPCEVEIEEWRRRHLARPLRRTRPKPDDFTQLSFGWAD